MLFIYFKFKLPLAGKPLSFIYYYYLPLPVAGRILCSTSATGTQAGSGRFKISLPLADGPDFNLKSS